ncbi:DUF6970 domain-containing protein [Hymenobacter latericus]|uniref:DUF6970 domain-containing protein n=1 Tax=Hymenobacter sp. YIM 151858-1 TaxID=2987688 RepID=UPI0022264F44|nr:hypothetical protein [Hymenobacter sp. YIM 151858-1]UYZ58365.1 hypothetical protein OIS50_15020 [Hymenobacter sp. YIM 151858-1]
MRCIAAFALGAVLLSGSCARRVDLTTPTDTSEPRATGNASTPAPTTTPTTIPVPDGGQIPFDKRNRPTWLDNKISKYLAAKPENPPIRILSYQYNGQTVYYESAPCCDQFTTLYDAKGNVLCSPDGGITGRGDGRCPDFEKTRTNEQLVWQDPRK